MKRTHLLIVCVCSVLSAGCAYRGAVYSEYEQTALDIRTTAASSAPVQVNFGYDQGVLAYVPKLNATTNSFQGEAVSVISWDNIGLELNPTQTGSNSLLMVDAGFISGIAADVASAPEFTTVTILAPDLKTTTTNEISVSSSAGDRISAAMGHPTPYGPDENTPKIVNWLKKDPKTNTPLLRAWLDKNGYKQYGIANVKYAAECAKA